MDYLKKHVEALVFCASEPINVQEMRACLSEMFEADIPEADILQALAELKQRYNTDDYVWQLLESGGGWQYLTKPAYQASISILLKQKSKKRLSASALETLAIVAYKQPISRPEIEQIRGVGCDYAMNKLLEKELIELRGKADTIGRPMLYGTSPQFMDYLGINSLSDLPQLKDIEPQGGNEIGENQEA